MLYKRIILQMFVANVFAKRHVIQFTTKLRQLGYNRDIDLGEVIAEAMVDSPAACGRLCEAHSTCNSVMLVGNLC